MRNNTSQYPFFTSKICTLERSIDVKKTLGLSCAAALLAALPMASYAQSSNTNMNTNGASQHAPGHQMKNSTTGSTTSPGASSYAPGQRMQNDTTGSVTGQGASSYAPGQQKKLPTDSTGTTTQRK
jgi:hypothetical protein